MLSPESAWDELVLWEELAVPLEAEAEPAGEAVLSLLEVPCEVLSEADVDPEEAPDEAAEELVLPEELLPDVLPELPEL